VGTVDLFRPATSWRRCAVSPIAGSWPSARTSSRSSSALPNPWSDTIRLIPWGV